jgi:hypothetical protein
MWIALWLASYTLEFPSNLCLICSKIVRHTDHSTVARFVNDGPKSVVVYWSSRGGRVNFVIRCCGIYAESCNCVERVSPEYDSSYLPDSWTVTAKFSKVNRLISVAK